MRRIRDQIEKLDIPYPQRWLLQREIAGDLACTPGGADAELAPEIARELSAIHATRAHRLLKRCGALRQLIEVTTAFLPMAFALTLLTEDDAMLNFIREGGIGMYG